MIVIDCKYSLGIKSNLFVFNLFKIFAEKLHDKYNHIKFNMINMNENKPYIKFIDYNTQKEIINYVGEIPPLESMFDDLDWIFNLKIKNCCLSYEENYENEWNELIDSYDTFLPTDQEELIDQDQD